MPHFKDYRPMLPEEILSNMTREMVKHLRNVADEIESGRFRLAPTEKMVTITMAQDGGDVQNIKFNLNRAP